MRRSGSRDRCGGRARVAVRTLSSASDRKCSPKRLAAESVWAPVGARPKGAGSGPWPPEAHGSCGRQIASLNQPSAPKPLARPALTWVTRHARATPRPAAGGALVGGACGTSARLKRPAKRQQSCWRREAAASRIRWNRQSALGRRTQPAPRLRNPRSSVLPRSPPPRGRVPCAEHGRPSPTPAPFGTRRGRLRPLRSLTGFGEGSRRGAFCAARAPRSSGHRASEEPDAGGGAGHVAEPQLRGSTYDRREAQKDGRPEPSLQKALRFDVSVFSYIR